MDSWIGSNNNGYTTSTYWSKQQAILACLNNKKLSDKNQFIKLNKDHLIPKVFFEDIFIDFNNFQETNKHFKRAKTAYTYFKNLEGGFVSEDQNQFLFQFFDEYSIIVILMEKEHKSLCYQNEMPPEFFLEGNGWVRYNSPKAGYKRRSNRSL